MRRRDIVLVDLIKLRGLPDSDDEKAYLCREAWPSMDAFPKRALVRKINQKLKQQDIKEALVEAFELVAGFTPAEALLLHVEHIRGFKRKVAIDGVDGAVRFVDVRDKPNYAALKDYESLAIGTAEKRISVRSQSVNVHVDGGQAEGLRREGPPPTRARVLKSGEYRLPPAGESAFEYGEVEEDV